MTPAPVLVVDVANVLGSRADGWWRDRAGAARRLVEQVRAATSETHDVVLVLEGAARAGAEETGDRVRLHVVHASAGGDDVVVAQARALADLGRQVTVVTADRGLRERVGAFGVQCRGPRWFLDLLG
ncbi:MAG: hypothetical protein ACLGH4_06885 [Actinomycetes bacterium]